MNNFKPDAVLIPTEALYTDNDGEHADPDECIRLQTHGDNNYAEVTNEYGRKFGERRGGQFFTEWGGEIRLLPDIHVVKIDETDYWVDEQVLKYCPRIYGVYVFDRRQHFHIWSTQPAYELHFIGSQWDESDELADDEYKRDEIFQSIIEGDTLSERVTYWGVRDIDRMLENEIKQGFFPPEGENGGYRFEVEAVTYNDAILECVEVNGSYEL